jgi:hypothetical protein
MKQLYKVKRVNDKIEINGDWNKDVWNQTTSLEIANDNKWEMNYKPKTEVNLLYDDSFIYLIYRIEDQFVKCVTDKINGPVWRDGCVEFFFSPNVKEPDKYFNLEINCGGTALMSYKKIPKVEKISVSEDDIKQIKIFSSMPGIIEKEITEPVTWVLELALPIKILQNYSDISLPRTGIKWKANFYKCAENNSHPHWLSWTEINSDKPNYHQPLFFGEIEFE